MAMPIDTIMTKKIDDISKRLDRQNSLYLAHSDEFKKCCIRFLNRCQLF